MKLNRNNPRRALTLIEVLLVIGVVTILVLVLLPSLHHPSTYASRAQCHNNLRQISLSFRQWAIDHGGEYPMNVSVTNGGTAELNSKGGVYLHFLILSNDLNTPVILHCPADEAHKRATTFRTNFTEANISYFVGLDAAAANPSMLLVGDRNITNGMLLPNRILELKSNSVAGWTKKTHNLRGNIGLADGSVHDVETVRLREVLANTGVATNRLALPLD